MKQKLSEQVATVFLCVAALFFLVVFGGINLSQFFTNKASAISQIDASEAEYVERELLRRSTSDCMLTRTDYGWRCEEIGTGKIFKVVAK